ncbi:exodeoxyribonuclease VII large subunit [Candidatus Margulisiibacteriota bacterium]
MSKDAITVSQLNKYIKSLLDNDLLLSSVVVSGEISNVRYYRAGNQIYFTLKDAGSQISCVLFSSTLSRLKFQPSDGLNVIVRGRVSVYEKRGQYSIQVFYMEPQGAGALASAFEQLKEKLNKEGLFAPERKKAIPQYPELIAVIAAEHGAAVKDIMAIAKRRCPLTYIKLFPAVVQGAMAPDSIVKQLNLAQSDKDVEMVIVSRGGGSLEDLWAFNEEKVARAIADCTIPVVSAVGHEIDFTIADFTADLRAATPSAAAELVVPDLGQLLSGYNNNLKNALRQKYQTVFQKFSYLKSKMELLNPVNILERGYSITKKNGKVIKDADTVSTGDEIETVLFRGTVKSNVKREDKTIRRNTGQAGITKY